MVLGIGKGLKGKRATKGKEKAREEGGEGVESKGSREVGWRGQGGRGGGEGGRAVGGILSTQHPNERSSYCMTLDGSVTAYISALEAA